MGHLDPRQVSGIVLAGVSGLVDITVTGRCVSLQFTTGTDRIQSDPFVISQN